MTVIANDFVPDGPHNANLITLSVGQHTDVVVEATAKSTDTIRMRITEGPSGLSPGSHTKCTLNDSISFTTAAATYYEDFIPNIVPNTNSAIDSSLNLFPFNYNNQPLDITVLAFAMPLKEPPTMLNPMTNADDPTGAYMSYMNNIAFRVDQNDPVLLNFELYRLSLLARLYMALWI